MPASLTNPSSPTQGSPQSAACHLLNLMTDGDWVYDQIPNKDLFDFSNMLNGRQTFRLTSQTLSLVESDPQQFTQVLTQHLQAVGVTSQNAAPAEQITPDLSAGIPPRSATLEWLLGRMANEPGVVRVDTGLIGEYADIRERPLLTQIEQLKQQLANREDMIAKLEKEVRALQSGTSRWISGAEASVLTLEEDQRTLQRAEAVELVTAMLAGAGFSLLRDPPGETAMWQQQLPTRPGVQVFFLLPVAEQELAPAELFAWVRDQVGVS